MPEIEMLFSEMRAPFIVEPLLAVVASSSRTVPFTVLEPVMLVVPATLKRMWLAVSSPRQGNVTVFQIHGTPRTYRTQTTGSLYRSL